MNINSIRKNMTEITAKAGTVLVSYQTPVAACVDGKWYRTEQYFSNTTSRHINEWLDGRKAEERPQSFFDNLL